MPARSPGVVTFVVLAIALFIGAEIDPFRALGQEKSAQPPVPVRRLVPGVPVDREFASDAPHAYEIELATGQLFQALIQQKGFDVIATLIGPDGQKLDQFSEPVYENEARTILHIAGSDGKYQLLLEPRLKAVTSGPYQLSAEVPRPATELERVRVPAKLRLKDVQQTLGRSTAIKPEDAANLIANLEDSLKIFQSLDNQPEMAHCLLSLGVVNSRSGNLTRALAFYERALPLFPQTSAGIAAKATTLNNIADAYLNLGETRKALEVYLQSLELKKEGRSRAITLDNIGAVYFDLGEYQQALAHHLEALASFRALHNRRDEAVALNNLAWLWERLGDPKKSVDYMLQALALVRESNERNSEARFLANAGNFYLLSGDSRQALELANQSLELSRSLKNRRTEAGGLQLLCKVYESLGEYDKAIESCNQLMSMGRANAEQVMTLTSLGSIFEKTGAVDKAVESRQAALAIYKTIGDPNGELISWHALGRLALRRGDLALAQSQLEHALELSESVRLKAGSHQLRSEYMVGVQQVYETYVDLLMQMHQQQPGKGYDLIALQFSERARARSLLDLMAEARAQIREGADVTLLEKERKLLEQLEGKDAAFRRLRDNEATKKQAQAIANEINDLTTQLQLVEASIPSSSPRYTELTQPKLLTAAEIQRQLLDSDTVLLEFALSSKQSWLWAVTPESVLTYQLPARQEIETAARNVYSLLTARQTRKGEPQEQWTTRVADADARFARQAGTLSQMLLGPLATKLQQEWKGKRLLIVAGGALEYLPFAALPLPAKENNSPPLIAGREVLTAPSASVLSLIRRETEGRQVPTKTIAVLADPVFEANDPRVMLAVQRKDTRAQLAIHTRSANGVESEDAGSNGSLRTLETSFLRGGLSRLPFSREEAEAISSIVPAKSLLKAIDFNASRARATDKELSNYRIIHFATHGLLNSENPELSGLVLSLIDENGRPQDGFLRMHELYNLRLPADLVVLSACQTGLGKEIKGEGLVGLTRGFMYAGARRVVASLWQVDDLATAELMKHFYKAMLKDGMRPAAALRSAQVELMKQKRWSSPYFWAAFVIQGEWK